ncbi:MAG: alpha/beta fold hydrolase [Dehalococcoidia bacterium]|nr:alpha/beta fold hydrolase [Dehalococcoidia bacterium]
MAVWPQKVGLEHRYVQVNGVRTHYLVAGDGPPVILLHGVGSSVVAWRENILPLARHLRVYAVDLPGHGDSEKPRMDYSLSAASRFMIGLQDALGLDHAHLIGQSLGGLIVLRFALDHPARVDRVVTVGTAGLGRDLSWLVRWISVPVVGEIIVHPTAGKMKHLLTRVMRRDGPRDEDLVNELYRARGSPGAERALVSMVRWGVTPFGLRGRALVLPELPRLKPPLLLIWGANDSISPVHHGYHARAALPTARLEVFEDCGHWAQMERADEFNQLVEGFLAGKGDDA